MTFDSPEVSPKPISKELVIAMDFIQEGKEGLKNNEDVPLNLGKIILGDAILEVDKAAVNKDERFNLGDFVETFNLAVGDMEFAKLPIPSKQREHLTPEQALALRGDSLIFFKHQELMPDFLKPYTTEKYGKEINAAMLELHVRKHFNLKH
jgi:hypothetical protein